MVGQRISHYRITDKLGEGGMGVVYKAEDLSLQRTVALKFLSHALDDSESKERFLREARASASLDHPNVCTVHEIGERDGRTFLAMAFIAGQTVKEKIAERPLKLDDALNIAIQAGEGLRAAHEKGIVHRDIKSANLMVTSEGIVKVMDFGLAQLVGQSGLTKSQTVLGTPTYMSPEQAQRHPVDRRTDIWSLGVVIYEMVTGRLPFDGEHEAAVLYSIVHSTPEPITALRVGVPPALDRVVAKSMAKNAAERYQHAAELVVDLRALQKGLPVSLRVLSRRRTIAAVALGITAILGLPIALNFDDLRDRLTGAATGRQIRFLAVLPLENLSGDPAQGYFSDGMTESLITDFAKISALKVISRPSVMRYKNSKKPLREIAAELNVDAVLQGSLLRTGDRIRINVQLVDAKTEQLLWAESYHRDLTDVLVLQSEVARTVARQVRAQLTPKERALLASAHAVNPAAYEAVLKGQVHASILTRRELDTAQEYYEAALEKDPNYALAYAGIAGVWLSRRAMWYAEPKDAGQKAMAAIQKALALDNTLAVVHAVLGRIQANLQWEWVEAEATYRRALEIEPNRAGIHIGYAGVLRILGRRREAVEHAEQGIELDPLNPSFRAYYAVLLAFVGRYDEAIDQARRALTAQPNQNMAHEALSHAFSRKGMLKETVEALIGIANRDEDPERARLLRRAYDEGRYQAAIVSAAELLAARWEESPSANGPDLSTPGVVTTAGQIAHLYDMAGLPEKTLEWWEKGVEHHDPSVGGIRATLPRGKIREDDPRFQALLQRVGIP